MFISRPEVYLHSLHPRPGYSYDCIVLVLYGCIMTVLLCVQRTWSRRNCSNSTLRKWIATQNACLCD